MNSKTIFEIIQSEKQNETKKNQKEWGKPMELTNTIKPTSIYIMGVPKEQKEKLAENLFKEIMAEKSPNWGREMDIHIHETQKFPNRMN